MSKITPFILVSDFTLFASGCFWGFSCQNNWIACGFARV